MLSAIKKTLLCVLVFAFCLAACHKDKDNDARVNSDIIQPAGAFTEVSVFDNIIGKNYIAKPGSNGAVPIVS